MGKLREWMCSILDWHSPDNIFYINDVTKCKYCGRWIMQDSQGNWFSASDSLSKSLDIYSILKEESK